MGYPKQGKPVVIEVLLRERPVSLAGELPRHYEGYPIRYSVRPPARGFATTAMTALATGGRIGWRTGGGITGNAQGPVPGTLGGFLFDGVMGDAYALSCAHVSGRRGTDVYEDPAARSPIRIGSVVYDNAPQQGLATKCNRIASPNAPTLDIGLIALDSAYAPAAGSADHVSLIADLSTGDPVMFYGDKSGQKTAVIGSLNVWREVAIESTQFCFGDMFTIEPDQPWYVKPKLSQDGDSGAWVVHTVDGATAWDGVLVGGDGVQSLCCFAEHVFRDCRARAPAGANLQLQP
jgi:hypothetical protein